MNKIALTAAAAVALCGSFSQDAGAAATAFVTSPNAHQIILVDLETNTVSGTIDTAADVSPLYVGVLPDGVNLLVASNDADSGLLLPVDSSAGTVGASLLDGNFLFAVEVTSDGNVAVVSDQSGQKIHLIHTDGSVIRTVSLTETAGNIAISPDDAKAYVSSNAPGVAGNVQVIDLADSADGSTDVTIPVGKGAGGIVASRDGAKVYVVNSSDETISVIDTATNAVDLTYDVGDTAATEFPRDLAISPDGATLYVITHFAPSTLFFVNASDGADLGSVTGFHDSVNVDVDDNGNVAVVTNAGGTLLGIVDLASKALTELEVGGAQVGVTIVGGVGAAPGTTGGTTSGTTTGGTTGGGGSGGCSLVR